jgi:hypothetical protein
MRLARIVRPTLPGFSVAPMRATDLGLKNVRSEPREGGRLLAGWSGAAEVTAASVIVRSMVSAAAVT